MSSIVLMQARTNSTRLPAKVLLPIQGFPTVVLAAKRAGNMGHTVLVVTSNESTDDYLCTVLKEYDIEYFRGNLNNTLHRFVNAVKSFSDDEVIIRLTADNIFPDGLLLTELENHFLEHNLDYLVCNGEKSGLPYGVSAEITKVKHLREALNQTNDPNDLEHVTPYIRRKFSETYFDKYRHLNLGKMRCTIDTLDDYLSVTSIFKDIIDPIHIELHELLKKFNTNSQPLFSKNCEKLVIGGAQLGFDYGINNATGQPNLMEVRRILSKAYLGGVRLIDTARAYGESEKVLGDILHVNCEKNFNIITKLSPLNEFNDQEQFAPLVECAVHKSILESLTNLNIKSLDYLMLHRAEHLIRWNGQILNLLKEYKSNGLVHKLGVSIQNPEELELALSFEEIEIIQLPFNILDHRWDNSIESIKEAKRTRNLTIHARSLLLQGLLLSENIQVWERAHINNAHEIISWLKESSNSFDRASIIDFCITYGRSQDWIDGIVVGMETVFQLEENLTLFQTQEFTQDEIETIKKNRPTIRNESLNPAEWKIKL